MNSKQLPPCLKAVFFDAGGTLLHPHPSVGHIYSRVARRHQVALTPRLLNQRFKSAFTAHKKRRPLVSKDWWEQVVKDSFRGIRFRRWNRFFNELYQEFEKKSCWRVEPGIVKALKALRKRGLRLAVVSNWDSRLPKLLKTMKLASYFERQFISYKIGAAKPNPKIFRTALRSMKLKPSEVLHVGNDWREDVMGARRAGMKGLLKNRSREIFGG